jgi:hypothetical protein
MVNMRHIDFELFPKFQTCLNHAKIAHIYAGDVLLFPTCWAHYFITMEESVSFGSFMTANVHPSILQMPETDKDFILHAEEKYGNYSMGKCVGSVEKCWNADPHGFLHAQGAYEHKLLQEALKKS